MFCVFLSLFFSHGELSLIMGICDLSQIKRFSSDFGDCLFSHIFGAILMLGIFCCAPEPALLFWFILFIDILICFFLFVLHIMMQLWCWNLMIYLTSWCCSDVGNFHCFFVFLISWSISDDGNVLLCPWASSAVLLMCLIDFLSKKHCCARCLFVHGPALLCCSIWFCWLISSPRSIAVLGVLCFSHIMKQL